jgi:maltose-binding protein MalE
MPDDSMAQRLASDIPAGLGPDLFLSDHRNLGDWVDRDHLLEPLTRRTPETVLNRFLPSAIRALTRGASLYGLPVALRFPVLVRDPSVINAPPDNFERLGEALVAGTDTAKGRTGLVLSPDLATLAALAHGFGGDVLSAGGTPRLSDLPSAESIEWLITQIRTGRIRAAGTEAEAARIFANGEAAMAILDPYAIDLVSTGRPFDASLLPVMPGGRRARPFLIIDALFMSAYSRNQSEALLLMDWLTTDEAAGMRMLDGRQAVANKAVLESDKARSDRRISLMRAQADNSLAFPSGPDWRGAADRIERIIALWVLSDTEGIPPVEVIIETLREAETGVQRRQGGV